MWMRQRGRGGGFFGARRMSPRPWWAGDVGGNWRWRLQKDWRIEVVNELDVYICVVAKMKSAVVENELS